MNERPTSVTVIAWLLIVFGVLGALGSLALMANTSNPLLLQVFGAVHLSLLETIVVGWIATLARLACGYGLLYRQNGARYLLVAYGAAALAYGGYTSGNPLTVIPGAVIFAVVVMFLFLPKVNAWFGKKGDGAEAA